MTQELLYLTRRDIEHLAIPMQDVIDQVALAFREKGCGRTLMPAKHWIAPDAQRFFSAMSGALPILDAVVCKWQSGSAMNAGLGLPYITGVLVLNRLADGLPIAIMDSTWITGKRTAAATAVVADYLAAPEPRILAIVGCGLQGRANVESLLCVHSGITDIQAFDIDATATERFAAEIEERFRRPVKLCRTVADTLDGADIVVTCGPIVPNGDRCIEADWLKPGALLVTLDYDCYLSPRALTAADAVFTDDGEQLRHLRDYGFFLDIPETVGEIGSILAGTCPGRLKDTQRIVSINMGIALEAAATAHLVYQRAMSQNIGQFLGY